MYYKVTKNLGTKKKSRYKLLPEDKLLYLQEFLKVKVKITENITSEYIALFTNSLPKVICQISFISTTTNCVKL